jgi:hypothetical protein
MGSFRSSYNEALIMIGEHHTNSRVPTDVLNALGDYYDTCVTQGVHSSKAREIVKRESARYPDFPCLAGKIELVINALCRVPWLKDGLGR